MAKKDRDYDEIIQNLDEMSREIETLKIAARALKVGADSAEATLKWRIDRKDINNVQSLAEVIMKVTATAEESVREMERKMRWELELRTPFFGPITPSELIDSNKM
jgi:predicted transcriptional regulator